MKNATTRETVPCAYVTKGKQRIKQFDKTVYLNNGDEFEIELYNPTTNKVLSQIELNGKSIGSGIVLRPGERVFLERYIETARKFLFDTYLVDSNNPDTQKAIALNGSVNVKFYNEMVFNTQPIYYENYLYTNQNKINFVNTCGSSTSTSTGDNTKTFTSSAHVNFNDNIIFASLDSFPMEQSKIETGRIEKGSASNQKFQFDNSQFNTYYTWESKWKILPLSQKPITSENVNAVWCVNCGRQRKKDSFKFCPHCGVKYE